MNRAHFALKLRTDRPKKDKTYQIYLYANLNSKIAWYTTNQSVEQKYWNEGKSEVKASCSNWSKINTEINNYSSKVSNLLAEFNLKGKELTRKHLNDVLSSAKYLSKDYYQFVENYKNTFSSNYSKLTLKGLVTILFCALKFQAVLGILNIKISNFWSEIIKTYSCVCYLL